MHVHSRIAHKHIDRTDLVFGLCGQIRQLRFVTDVGRDASRAIPTRGLVDLRGSGVQFILFAR